MARMDAAAGVANAKVLIHPTQGARHRAIEQPGLAAILDFEHPLGIDRERPSSDARRWSEAVAEARNSAFEAAADGLDGARRFGAGSLSRAKAVGGRLPGNRAKRNADQTGLTDEARVDE